MKRRGPRAARLFAAVPGVVLVAATSISAAPRTVRGPIESRDEFLLAQSLLTLPPLGAAVLPAGRTELRVDAETGNDFGLQAEPGGRRENVLFFVDGEHRTFAATVRHGLGRGWAVGARVPVHWRGGGWLDSVIDPFHGFFGFPDSGRSLYARGRLRVEGRESKGVPISWTGGEGTGLGAMELEVTRALRAGTTGGPAIAIAVRAVLPTSTGAFEEGGRGGGAQALISQPLGGAFDLHGGVGASVLGPESRDGLAYARNRAQGFVALEWRPVPAWSALLQWEASGRLVEDVEAYPGFQLSLRIGSKVDAGAWRFEGGFVEGIKDLDNTVDFGAFAAVSRRF